MLKILLILTIYLSLSNNDAQCAKIVRSTSKHQRSNANGNISLINRNIHHGRPVMVKHGQLDTSTERDMDFLFTDEAFTENIELTQKKKAVARPTLRKRRQKQSAFINKRIQEESAEMDELKAPPSRKEVLQIINNLPDIHIPEKYTIVLCAKAATSGYSGENAAIGKAFTNDSAACFSICYGMDECFGINFSYKEGVCLFLGRENDWSSLDGVLETMLFEKMSCSNDINHIYDLIDRDEIPLADDDPVAEFLCTTSGWDGYYNGIYPFKVAQNVGIDRCINMCYSDDACQAVNYIELPGFCYFLEKPIEEATDLMLRYFKQGFQYFHVPKGCENGSYTCQSLDEDHSNMVSCGIPHESHKPSIGEMAGRHRIMGGTEAEPHSYPWIVDLRLGKQNKHWCQGVLLPSCACAYKSDIVLTAAHCTTKNGFELLPWEIDVYLGKHDTSAVEHGQVVVKINEIIRHLHYFDDEYGNDYALLHLANPVTFNEYIRPVCLPESDGTPSKPKTCIVAGWGDINNTHQTTALRHMFDPVIPDGVCAFEMEQRNVTFDSETMLCAGNMAPHKDTCKGDSGSPLVCYEHGKYTVFGLVSFGPELDSCNAEGMPGIYSRVSAAVEWISQKIHEVSGIGASRSRE